MDYPNFNPEAISPTGQSHAVDAGTVPFVSHLTTPDRSASSGFDFESLIAGAPEVGLSPTGAASPEHASIGSRDMFVPAGTYTWIWHSKPDPAVSGQINSLYLTSPSAALQALACLVFSMGKWANFISASVTESKGFSTFSDDIWQLSDKGSSLAWSNTIYNVMKKTKERQELFLDFLPEGGDDEGWKSRILSLLQEHIY
jgi:hypothetical protein